MMENITRQDVEKSLFKGQKYHFEGYPEWYNEQLAKNEPIPIQKFRGNMQKAAFFYQRQANKLHFANAVLQAQLRSAIKEKQNLNQLITSLQGQERDSADQRKKRVRRCASEIQRKYVCPVAYCEKSYGTQGSMAQHMRLKHPQIEFNPADFTVIVTKGANKQQNRRVKKEQEQPVSKQLKKQ